jgi:AcrR family transcriptional regulator
MSRPTTKRKDIEATALRLFSARGLAQVTIKDIAREAHCAEGALYRHYASKEDLAWSLFKREVEHFSGRVREVWFQPGTCVDKLKRGIRLFCRFFDEDPVAFSFILLSQYDFPHDKRINPELNPDRLLSFFIREGIKRGEFRTKDRDLATALILGMVLQPATMLVQRKLQGTMISKSPQIINGCLEVLGVPAGKKK